MSNAWIRKTHEAKLVRIVEWAQKHRKEVETLTEADIREALKET